jgi:hypothetical protein
MYVDPDFKSKKALKEAVKAGQVVTCYSPGPFPCPSDGVVSVEGPHYPKPHTWYARVQVKDSKVIKVIS